MLTQKFLSEFVPQAVCLPPSNQALLQGQQQRMLVQHQKTCHLFFALVWTHLSNVLPCKSDILGGAAYLQVATPPPKVGRLQGFISKLRRGGSKQEEEYDLSRPASIAGPRPLDSEADLSPATKSGTSSLVTHPCACDSVSRHALINCMHGTPVDKCRMSF